MKFFFFLLTKIPRQHGPLGRYELFVGRIKQKPQLYVSKLFEVVKFVWK